MGRGGLCQGEAGKQAHLPVRRLLNVRCALCMTLIAMLCAANTY